MCWYVNIVKITHLDIFVSAIVLKDSNLDNEAISFFLVHSDREGGKPIHVLVLLLPITIHQMSAYPCCYGSTIFGQISTKLSVIVRAMHWKDLDYPKKSNWFLGEVCFSLLKSYYPTHWKRVSILQYFLTLLVIVSLPIST